MKYAILTLSLLTLLACQTKTQEGAADNAQQAQPSQPGGQTEANAQVAYVKYPMLPDSILRYMRANCDNMEVIFNDLPISMNPGGQAACRSNIEHFAGLPASLHPKSQPQARAFYQTNGEEIISADLYFDDYSKGFVFFVDNQPTYSNQMSEKGVNYYTNILGSIQQAKDQIQPQQQ